MFAPIRRRLRRLREVHGIREAVLLVRAVAFASVVPLLLRLPLPRLEAFLRRRRPRPGRRPDAERTVRLVSLALDLGRPLVRTGCLTQGVTLFAFLRRTDADVSLRFGMSGPDAEGHCWVVLDGTPVLEPDDPRDRYLQMYEIRSR